MLNHQKNKEKKLYWLGVYEGLLPCENCSGLNTRISLYDNGLFSKTDTDLDNENQKFTESGEIIESTDGNIITLAGSHNQMQFSLQKNSLVMLSNGQISHYILSKKMPTDEDSTTQSTD